MFKLRATIIANLALLAATAAFSSAGTSIRSVADITNDLPGGQHAAVDKHERPFTIAPMRCPYSGGC